MKKLVLGVAVLAMAFGAVLALNNQATAADESPSISDVMKKAHGGGAKSLVRKVATGKASDAEKKELLSLYEALAKNKPPKGDKAAWDKKTKALVTIAKAVVEGKAGAAARLTRAANCRACHNAHKPK